MTDQFRLAMADGDEWYERLTVVSGQVISVELRSEPQSFQASLPYAEAVLNDIENFIALLYQFVAQEKGKYPVYTKDLDQLKVDAIAFISKDEPEVAEITFEESSDGRVWGCAYKNGRLFNLGFDD